LIRVCIGFHEFACSNCYISCAMDNFRIYNLELFRMKLRNLKAIEPNTLF
jgi:hypothetical protein